MYLLAEKPALAKASDGSSISPSAVTSVVSGVVRGFTNF